MKIAVTPKCLKRGLKKSYTHDAIAQAFREHFRKYHKYAVSVLVMADYALLDGAIVWLPERVCEVIQLLDRGKPVEPFDFEVPDLPDDFFQYKGKGK